MRPAGLGHQSRPSRAYASRSASGSFSTRFAQLSVPRVSRPSAPEERWTRVICQQDQANLGLHHLVTADDGKSKRQLARTPGSGSCLRRVLSIPPPRMMDDRLRRLAAPGLAGAMATIVHSRDQDGRARCYSFCSVVRLGPSRSAMCTPSFSMKAENPSGSTNVSRPLRATIPRLSTTSCAPSGLPLTTPSE